MKKTIASLAIVVLMLAALTPAYAKQASIAGNWTFRVPELSLRLVLVQKGKNITGTLQNPHGNPIHLKGTYWDGQFKFTGSSEGGEFAYRLSGTGTLQKDGSFAGNLSSNVGDMMWTAIRAEAK
jgi:hypothetical protein